MRNFILGIISTLVLLSLMGAVSKPAPEPKYHSVILNVWNEDKNEILKKWGDAGYRVTEAAFTDFGYIKEVVLEKKIQ